MELGFGMAISATQIESHKIDEHVIVECNDEVFKRLIVFGEKSPNKVTPMKGMLRSSLAMFYCYLRGCQRTKM